MLLNPRKIKHMRTFLLFALLTAAAIAQTPPAPAAKKVSPPVVSKDLETDLWRAQAESNAAQLALEHSKEQQVAREKEAARQAVMQRWVDFCGKDFVTSVNAAGKPVCAEKPPAPPTPLPTPATTPTPPPDKK